MANQFFDDPILNSPYGYPSHHWELEDGQPTHRIIDSRRGADFLHSDPQAPQAGSDVRRPAQIRH